MNFFGELLCLLLTLINALQRQISNLQFHQQLSKFLSLNNDAFALDHFMHAFCLLQPGSEEERDRLSFWQQNSFVEVSEQLLHYCC